jgi:hypothetical protein
MGISYSLAGGAIMLVSSRSRSLPAASAKASVGDLAEKSLLEVLSEVADPRSRHGVRHSVCSLLSLLVVGLLSGSNTVKGCVLYGRERKALRLRLGFTHPKCPSQSTYTRLFAVLTISSLRDALEQWLEALAAARAERSKRPLVASVDGKALRATGQHVLNVFVQDWWRLLDMREVGAKENELSAFGEALGEMLKKYPFLSIFTFDAMFAQHSVVEELTRNNRMGIFQIKDNQAETVRRLQRWFSRQRAEGYQIRTVEKGAIIS